jgi:hypothetical protein
MFGTNKFSSGGVQKKAPDDKLVCSKHVEDDLLDMN